VSPTTLEHAPPQAEAFSPTNTYTCTAVATLNGIRRLTTLSGKLSIQGADRTLHRTIKSDTTVGTRVHNIIFWPTIHLIFQKYTNNKFLVTLFLFFFFQKLSFF
jgi:hypothetical protein